ARPRSAEHGRHRGVRRDAPTMPLVAAGVPADGEMADLAGAAVSAVHPPAVHDDAAADALAHAEDGERARAVAGPEPVVRGGECLHVVADRHRQTGRRDEELLERRLLPAEEAGAADHVAALRLPMHITGEAHADRG